MMTIKMPLWDIHSGVFISVRYDSDSDSGSDCGSDSGSARCGSDSAFRSGSGFDSCSGYSWLISSNIIYAD